MSSNGKMAISTGKQLLGSGQVLSESQRDCENPGIASVSISWCEAHLAVNSRAISCKSGKKANHEC